MVTVRGLGTWNFWSRGDGVGLEAWWTRKMLGRETEGGKQRQSFQKRVLLGREIGEIVGRGYGCQRD